MVSPQRGRFTTGPVLGTAYLWLVGGLSIAVLAYVARFQQPVADDIGLAAELLLLAVIAQHFPLDFGPQHKTDTSIAVYFACLLLFDTGAALVLVAASQLLGQATLALRRAPGSGKRLRGSRGILFNTSQLVIATALAGAAYDLLAPQHSLLGLHSPENLVAVPAAAVVIHVANSLAVAAMVGFQLQQSVFRTWLSDWTGRALERAGLLIVGLVAALAAGQYAWAPFLMALPAVILFLAQRRALRLLAAEQIARADAERAHGHLTLLAQASAKLASSLDFNATLQCAVRLLVPALADGSSISIDSRIDSQPNGAASHTDRVQEDRLRQLLLCGSIGTLTGENVVPELHCVVPESLLAKWAHNTESLGLLHELGLSSAIIVPLFARGQMLGTLGLYATGPQRSYNSGELAVAEDLAQRIAMAIDNARLYEEEQRIVGRLQQLRGQVEASERERVLGDERERIARDLHDRVEQTFYSIGLTASALLASPPARLTQPTEATLAHIRSSAKQGAEELRAAIFALSRARVIDRGLVRTLWQLIRDFQERTGLDTDLVESGVEQRTPPEVAEVLHAVAREGLANVEQHARASAVVVSLRFEPGLVTLTVQDDGVGASVLLLSALADSVTRFGLRGVREQVLRLGGTFSAAPGDDEGFVLRAGIPLRRDAAA